MTEAPGAAPRFRELDGLRGLAVLVVLAGHYVTSIEHFYPSLPASPVPIEDGRFGVQLFFLISGYVILLTATRSRRPSDFVIARVSRLYPAYWVALAVSLTVIALSPAGPFAYTAREAVINVTMLQRFLLVEDIDPVYWTLAVELSFYFVMIALLVAVRGRLTDRVVRRFSLGWVALAVAVGMLFHDRPVDFVTKVVLNLTNAEYAPLFCAGMMFYLSRRDGRLEPLSIVFSGAAALVAGLLHSPRDGLAIAVVCLFFAAIVVRPDTSWLAGGPLNYLGRISYSMYLLHTIPGFTLIVYGTPVIGRWPATAMAVLLVTGLSIAAQRWVETDLSRAFRRWLTRTRDRLRPAVAEEAVR